MYMGCCTQHVKHVVMCLGLGLPYVKVTEEPSSSLVQSAAQGSLRVTMGPLASPTSLYRNRSQAADELTHKLAIMKAHNLNMVLK